MKHNPEFIPEDNHDDPVTSEHLAFGKELQENLNADFPVTSTVAISRFESDAECSIFVDSDEIVERFDEIADKIPELVSRYDELKEENPHYREQWMKNRVFESYLKDIYLPKKLDEYGWGKSETVEISRIEVITMTLDQEYLRNSLGLMKDIVQPPLEDAERTHDFVKLFISSDSKGVLSKYRKMFLKTLINESEEGRDYVWRKIVESSRIFEKPTGRHVDIPERFEDAYKKWVSEE